LGDLTEAPIEAVITATCSVLPRSATQLDKRARSVRQLLELLSASPGQTWQQRWEASGWSTSGVPLATLNPPPSKSWTMTSGFSWAVAVRALVPALPALRANAVSDFATIFLGSQADAELQALVEAIDAAPVSPARRNNALTQLACMLTVQAIPVADITPSGLMHFARATRDHSTARDKEGRGLPGALLWQVLRETGRFPAGTPTTLRVAATGGRRSVTGLVDAHHVQHSEVRQLLIDYITQRATLGMDYGTLSRLVRDLVRNFWCVVERLNPNQEDLNLDEATYTAWRAEVDTITTADGDRPRQGVWDLMIAVRSLYLDLHSWALQDPARWGRWAAPCPIPPGTTRGYMVHRRRMAERIADRTRSRQPMLDLLVEHVRSQRERWTAILAAARKVADLQDIFIVDGVSYRRLLTTRDTPTRRYPQKGPRARRGAAEEAPPPTSTVRVQEVHGGPIVDAEAAESHSFWTWAIVEVLRLTGLRHEELLELTHLSLRQYHRPNGELVPLLVVAPSKTDRERVIPMSPELLHVTAAILRRHHERSGAVPLVRRWDPLERQHSDLLPFLFQPGRSALPGVLSPTFTARLLRKACEEVAADRPQFHGLTFTPHDFRRLFATELVNNGLPIHIGAALLGHASVQTTRGYVAVFNEDLVQHYQLHLTRRRQLRPPEEYRGLTEGEWNEFEDHFDTRKVELGSCGRPYATPCVHEHACLRCPMLHVEPRMLPRLDDIESDLLARREQAENEGWRGELEGLEVTIAHLRAKRTRGQRLVASQLVRLPFPTLRGGE